MFEIDPATTWIDPAAGPVSALIQSLNTPLVAAGEHPAEAVQSWIVSRQAATGLFDVFVYFHLTESNHGIVYRWTDGSVAPPQLAFVQEEAMAFCESMGFMMDNLNFTVLDPGKQAELMGTLPPFVSDLSTLVKEVELEVESTSKKKVDPLEDFVRMKQARAESGQMGTSEFMAAQGEAVHEPIGPGPGDGGAVFDPSAPHVARADAPHLLPESGDVQIEITEIEGLELLPEGGSIPLTPEPVMADPPVVRGSISAPPPAPAPMAAAPPPAMETIPGIPPPRRVREKTPPGDISILDAEFAPPSPAPAPMAASPAGVLPGAAPMSELSIDDMLAGVGGDGGESDDLSSELDAILDRVENTNPRVAEPAPPAPNGGDDVQIDLGLGAPGDDPMSLLDALMNDGAAPAAAPPAAPPPTAPSNVASTMPPPLSGTPAATKRPAPPAAPLAAAPSPLDALESAWMEGGATNARAAANGNGNGRGASALSDIATDDLARLLAML